MVSYPSKIGIFDDWNYKKHSFKIHSPLYEELACLHVHLYLNIPDKNELPVVVNWICWSTASSPQNVWCHKWIKLSLWCKNIQYSQCLAQFQGNTALLMHFRLVIWRWEGFIFFCLRALLSLWTFGLRSRVQRCKLCTISDALLLCVQNKWPWVLTACHTDIVVTLVDRIPLSPVTDLLLCYT